MELSKTRRRIDLFRNLKNLYCPGGWMGGWVGGWVGGDQKGPSIWLKIEYSNKQSALIPNLASKIVYGY